jgi:uncharacterized protein (TIGR00730 family)
MNITPHQKEFLERVNKKFLESFEVMNKVSDRKKVTVYGSARLSEANPIFSEIETFSHALRKQGWIMMSGGGPGVMKAALDGEDAAKEDETIAFQIDLQKEQADADADIGIKFTDFFVRKYFLRTADVFIVAPGGFGTMDEAFEVITLLQTKKLKYRRVIFYKQEYWAPLLDWFRDTMLKQGMISSEDLELFQIADTPEEIIKMVNKPA